MNSQSLLSNSMASSSHSNRMMEDYANLSIADDESEGLDLNEISEDNSKIDYDRCLIGSFLTDWEINFIAMQETLSSIWRPVKGVFMEETSVQNMFMFKFFHALDVQRVLNDGPWTLDTGV